MTTQEKERLGLALAASLVIHAVAFLIVQFGDWRVAPLPEFSGPMQVEMAPPEVEPEVEPDPAPEDPAPEDPAPEDPAPPDPAPEEPAPEAEQSAPSGETRGRDPLAGERRNGELGLEDIYERDTRPGARSSPPEDDEMRELPPEEQARSQGAPPPDWATRPRETVEEAGISTEGVDEGEIEDLAERVATDPDFRRSLQEVTDALERRRSDGRASDRTPRESPDIEPQDEPSPEDRAPGDSRFEWVGTGSRELTNPPPVPDNFFSSADFDGSVPAQASFVVVFEVDSSGNVVPGSVIFQQGSGYVRATEKLRGRVRQWSFEPAAASARDATGIFTLVVQREDIR
ncbi:MAG: hypothetical protein ACLFPO_00070 [Spirochaetaceae bacterium]